MKQKAIYTESGWQAEVEILEDSSDPNKNCYKLKVIKTLESGKFGSMPDGHIFTVSADKRHMIFCNWRLSKVEEV